MDVVKISSRKSGTGGRSASLGVPRRIAEALEAANIESFTVTLTEEGILYKPSDEDGSIEAPTWLKPAKPAPTA